MKPIHKHYNHFLRTVGIGIITAFGILSAIGSGGGSSTSSSGGTPSGGTTSSIKAFNFDANNTVTAAELAATVMSFFSDFTSVGQQVLTTLAAANPANSPFDLGMCANAGDSKLTWKDTDNSGDISVGDTATLVLTNCDVDGSGATGTGTVDFLVTSVDSDPLPNSVGLTVTMNLAFTDAPDINTYTGTFGMKVSTSDNVVFTATYTADDATKQKLGIAKNNVTKLEFACFNVAKIFSVANAPGTYMLSPSGVINASDSILSLASGPQLSFASDWMESGTQRLLSMSVPDCATLGVPNGVSDSDGSYIDMEAQGGGMVRLHTFDSSNNEIFTNDSIWDNLVQ